MAHNVSPMTPRGMRSSLRSMDSPNSPDLYTISNNILTVTNNN